MDVDCKYCGVCNSHLSSCPTRSGDLAMERWKKGYDRGRENLESEESGEAYRLGWRMGKEFFEHEVGGHDL